MPTSDTINSEQSSSSSSEPEDHSSSQDMLHPSSVADGAGVGPIPKPSPRLQPNNNNNNPHQTRVVVCGLPAAGSDFTAPAKPSSSRRRRPRGGGWGGPPASSNKKAKTSSPKSTTRTRQEAVGGGDYVKNGVAASVPSVACLRASASGKTTNNYRASLLRQGLLLVGESPSPNFVEKWNALLEVEMKLYLRRVALIREQIQLLANI